MEYESIKIDQYFYIPDGTLLAPYFNPRDSMSDLPFDLVDGFSVASGIIKPGVESIIHYHPHVAQLYFVLSRELLIKIKDSSRDDLYEVLVKKMKRYFPKRIRLFS